MNVDDGNMANAPAAFIDDGNINLCSDTKEIAKILLRTHSIQSSG